MQLHLLYLFIKTLTEVCHSVYMIKHNHTKQKGFIALFFTMSISAMLLAYVYASSESTFGFMRSREDFVNHRSEFVHDIRCADSFVDMIIRSVTYTEHTYVFEGVMCNITNNILSEVSPNTRNFFFISGSIQVSGTIHNGLISDVYFVPISL
jgi:hypothetical protein